MSKANESAFSRAAFLGPNGELEAPAQAGLTKREYFAAMAMQGLVSFVPPSPTVNEYDSQHIAFCAVRVADALIAELDKSCEKFPGYLGDVNGVGCDPDTV